MSKKDIKNRLLKGYRLRRNSWPKGKFIFLDRTNTIRTQNFGSYLQGINGNDWAIIY